MKKLNKNFKINQLVSISTTSDFLIILQHVPANTQTLTDIRNNLKKMGFNMVITKNSLLIKALGSTYSKHLADSVNGAVAVIYNTEPSPKLPAMLNSLKDIKYTLLSGRYKNRLLTTDQWNWLKGNYSEEHVYSKVINAINAPAVKLAKLANQPAIKVGRILKHTSKDNTN